MTFVGGPVDRGTPEYSLEEGTPYYINASGYFQSGLDPDEVAACQTTNEQFSTIKCTHPMIMLKILVFCSLEAETLGDIL